MSTPRTSGMLAATWTIPLLLAGCTAIALGVGLLYDGIWDVLASLLLAVPVLSFLERYARRQKR